MTIRHCGHIRSREAEVRLTIVAMVQAGKSAAEIQDALTKSGLKFTADHDAIDAAIQAWREGLASERLNSDD